MLEIDESTVRRWVTSSGESAVTVRDVLAGTASVCRAVGAELVAAASPPPPARSAREQLMAVVAKVGDLSAAVLADDDGATDRAILAAQDALAALQAIRARRST